MLISTTSPWCWPSDILMDRYPCVTGSLRPTFHLALFGLQNNFSWHVRSVTPDVCLVWFPDGGMSCQTTPGHLNRYLQKMPQDPCSRNSSTSQTPLFPEYWIVFFGFCFVCLWCYVTYELSWYLPTMYLWVQQYFTTQTNRKLKFTTGILQNQHDSYKCLPGRINSVHW